MRKLNAGFIKKTTKKIFVFFIVLFILLNISSAFHAYKFTHFSETKEKKSNADKLSFLEKTTVLFFGVSNPRPKINKIHNTAFEIIKIKSENEELECWQINVDSAKGDVIIFHGYGSSKSALLTSAKLIQEMGFNTLLVDFRGSGGSTGNTTTVGFYEAKDVEASVKYLKSKNRKNIYLLGSSMGAAAVIKATAELNIGVKGIIIECPYESLIQTTKNRFEKMGIPTFPFAYLLVFWGGIENGFWGFSLNPAEYSNSIKIPSLLIYGEKDARVKRFEIDNIYSNLKGNKELLIFPEAGHGNYIQTNKDEWIKKVNEFLKN